MKRPPTFLWPLDRQRTRVVEGHPLRPPVPPPPAHWMRCARCGNTHVGRRCDLCGGALREMTSAERACFEESRRAR